MSLGRLCLWALALTLFALGAGMAGATLVLIWRAVLA